MKKILPVALVLCIFACSGRDDVTIPEIDRSLLDEASSYIVEHYRSPEKYVIDKFRDHDIVLVGEYHRIKHDPELIQAMIPRLYENGIYTLAIEFAEREDQPLIDRLLSGDAYDEALARKINFNAYMDIGLGGYQEYCDLFRAAWELNRALSPGARRFTILGLNNSYDWSYLKTREDYENPQLRANGWTGQTEKDWADVLIENVIRRGEKALVYGGIHHMFTKYRQPIIRNGELVYIDDHFGNFLYRAIGKRTFTIFLHSPWPPLGRWGEEPWILPADWMVDRMLEELEPRYRNIGFDLKGTPMGAFTGETTYYKNGYADFRLETIYDGYICQGRIADYRFVTPIDDFFNETNLEEARRQFINPVFRNASLEHMNRAISGDADIKKHFRQVYRELERLGESGR